MIGIITKQEQCEKKSAYDRTTKSGISEEIQSQPGSLSFQDYYLI